MAITILIILNVRAYVVITEILPNPIIHGYHNFNSHFKCACIHNNLFLTEVYLLLVYLLIKSYTGLLDMM